MENPNSKIIKKPLEELQDYNQDLQVSIKSSLEDQNSKETQTRSGNTENIFAISPTHDLDQMEIEDEEELETNEKLKPEETKSLQPQSQQEIELQKYILLHPIYAYPKLQKKRRNSFPESNLNQKGQKQFKQ